MARRESFIREEQSAQEQRRVYVGTVEGRAREPGQPPVEGSRCLCETSAPRSIIFSTENDFSAARQHPASEKRGESERVASGGISGASVDPPRGRKPGHLHRRGSLGRRPFGLGTPHHPGPWPSLRR